MRTRTAPAKEWMGTSTASTTLGVSLRGLYRMIDTGKIPAYKIGRVIRLRRVDVERVSFLLDLERLLASQPWCDGDWVSGESVRSPSSIHRSSGTTL